MRKYNKILEAIHRGIKLALDDFDDEQDLIGQQTETIKDTHYTKEYLYLMNEVVDLGLPSGTLWCKYNLDVNPNQLFKAEDWYGKYYAWGELEGNKTNKNGKIYFDWSNYKFGNSYTLTKYCNNPSHGLNGFTDNLSQLTPEDDAVYQNKKFYNFKFHIPTKEQCEELLKYTTNYWIKNYDPNKIIHNPENDGGIRGLNGRIFEGKKNRNQLFIPAGGYCDGLDINQVGSRCYLQSSSCNLNYPNAAYLLSLSFYFGDNNIFCCNRYYGYCIRPVINL